MLKLNWDNIAIMVVDDNTFMRRLIVTTLRALGINNIVAKAGAKDAIEGLKQSRTNPIQAEFGSVDIILSDFVLPELDGALFLRWVRSNKLTPDRFVPFIMVSGAADQTVVETARDAGVTEFLAKPFSAKAIADRILEVIKNPRQFVLAEGYFGPDRRRHDRPADWHTLYDDHSKPESDRRVTKASEIQLVHTRSNIRSLREDVKAIYFRPINKLREKLGPNAMRGQLDFDPLVIQAAEQRIQELVGDYSTWVSNYLDSIAESYQALKHGESRHPDHVLNINQIAHELRGQGGIFDYPLITAFGKTLYEATLASDAPVTENRLKLIKAHIDAIRVVFTKKINGQGGDVGRAMMKDIQRAVQKYSEPLDADAL